MRGGPTSILIPSDTQNCPGVSSLPGIVVAGGGNVGDGFGVGVFDGSGVCVDVGISVGVLVAGTGVSVFVGGGVAVTTTTAVTTTVSLTGVAVSEIRMSVGKLVAAESAINAVADGMTFATVVGDAAPNPKFEPKRIINATHNNKPIETAAAIARWSGCKLNPRRAAGCATGAGRGGGCGAPERGGGCGDAGRGADCGGGTGALGCGCVVRRRVPHVAQNFTPGRLMRPQWGQVGPEDMVFASC